MRSLLALAPVLLLAATAAGQTVVLLDEPFNYASDAELEAVWDASGTSNPYYYLDVEIGNPDPSYAMPSPEASFQGRLARNLGSDYNPTDEHPLVLSFDFYLPEGGSGTWWSGARHYVELRGYSGDVYGSGDLQNLLAIGLYNNSGDEFHTEYYQGRVANGVSWITLDEEGSAPFRSPGWHRMEIWVWGALIEFWIDDQLCEIEARPSLPDPFGFDCVVLGSDLTANWHDSWVDNVRVQYFVGPVVTWYTIGAGGVVFSVGGVMSSSDGDVKLSSSIGRPDAGAVMTGGDITLTSGFWAGVVASIAGDCDFDGDVDLDDFADFEACLSGPGGGLPEPSCACFDCDDSGDVDLEDFAAFQQAFTGS